MIDTVKLLINIRSPLTFRGEQFVPTIRDLVYSRSYGKAILNPPPAYAKTGKYMPRLTLYKRPIKFGYTYQLGIEFSAPKLLFGNNFDELTEQDFTQVLSVLATRLYELTGRRFTRKRLAEANISAWHPAKNIVFADYTACQTVLNTIAKFNISRTYDLQKTDFRDGHALHIHCNTLDIVFYDKLRDLRKARTSEKRAIEKENTIQLSLLDEFEARKPLEIFRYEVRLVGRPAIKRAYPDLVKWTFEELFGQQQCQKVLLKHWQRITLHVDLLAMDAQKPYELLQNYLKENPNVTQQTAMAAVTGLLITGQVGIASLRNMLDAHYGRHAWHRFKPLLKPPKPHRFTYFKHIDEALERFIPTSIESIEELREDSK